MPAQASPHYYGVRSHHLSPFVNTIASLNETQTPFYSAFPALSLAACLVPAAAQAQAVWNNADDRDYDGNGVFVAAYWSYGYLAATQGTPGHVRNWGVGHTPARAA